MGAALPTPGGRRGWSRGSGRDPLQLRGETARPGGWATRESGAAAAPQCSREKQRGGQAIEATRSTLSSKTSVLVVMEASLSFP